MKWKCKSRLVVGLRAWKIVWVDIEIGEVRLPVYGNVMDVYANVLFMKLIIELLARKGLTIFDPDRIKVPRRCG